MTDDVAALAAIAREKHWPPPLYEKIKVHDNAYNVRVMVAGETYQFRSVYPTYEEAKQSTAAAIVQGLRREIPEGGIPKRIPSINAIVTAHRGANQMTPDTSSTSPLAYVICDEFGYVRGDAKELITWMLIQTNQTNTPPFLHRIVTGVLWLVRNGFCHIALYLEEEDVIPLQVILTELRIPHVICGRRHHTIEIHQE